MKTEDFAYELSQDRIAQTPIEPRDDDWVSLPLTIDGTLDDPQVHMAENTMQYLLQKTLPNMLKDMPVSYTHLTLPTTKALCRSRWSPYH